MISRHLLALLLTSTAAISLSAQNIRGYVRCKNSGVAGVVVSDGDSVTVTDGRGFFTLQSQKRNGYVFYSLPRGYEPEVKDGFRPQFWQKLTYPSAAIPEMHNFTLKEKENDDYTLVIGADSHLANRTNDLAQFRDGYMECLKAEKRATNGGSIYSMILGDLSWDGFWYTRNYDLEDFMNSCKSYGYPMILWPVIGNHDNDGATQAGTDCDFLASSPWRSIVAPNYYSFNLGQVHYVVLDDIYYKNEDTGGSYNKGIVGSRNYNNQITQEQLDWLARDLSYIEDKETPIVVAVHIPVWKLETKSPFKTKANLKDDNTKQLCDLLKEYSNVHIISGHTHYNYHAHPAEYPNIMEHNIAAICATWWWTGYTSGHHICKDGSPGGYSLWHIEGDKMEWQYKSIEQNGNLQMRIYDMNTVKEYFATNDSALKMLDLYPNRTTYTDFSRNSLLLNVFSYDTDWKISVLEGTTPRIATRIYGEDPFHTISYDVPRVVQNGSYTEDWVAGKTSHLFRVILAQDETPVTVRLTDSFGREYVQTIQRPHPFCLEMEQLQINEEPTGITPELAQRTSCTPYLYDMQGRRIYRPRHGVYIRNGKKVFRR
ncbi:MAG: calcineurin-like phosphoesterase family protein [Bacteroidaceae bacterium]|nr:calcineurin-like phosphoesterase family protein [Bacteroidaceae bacterium]